MLPWSVLVCGVPVDDVTLEEALDRIDELVDRGRLTGRSHQVATVNVDFLVNAMEDPAIRALLQRVDLALPDGMPVVWAARMMGTPLRQRVAGADLLPALAARWAGTDRRIALFGAGPRVAERAAEVLRSRFPGLQVEGMGAPVLASPEDTDPTVVGHITAQRPDVLAVALGHPKQELWIDHHRDRLGVPVMIGVGASLDFLAGMQRRAPTWMQRTGTEWLHRAVHEPGRLGPRYAHDLVRFGPELARGSRRLRPATPTPEAPVVVERHEQVTVVRPGGRVRLDPATLGWDERSWREPPPGHHVVVDLEDRTSLDHGELAQLAVLAKRLTLAGGALTLTSVGAPLVRWLLERRVYGFLGVSSHPMGAVAAPTGPEMARVRTLPGPLGRPVERRRLHA